MKFQHSVQRVPVVSLFWCALLVCISTPYLQADAWRGWIPTTINRTTITYGVVGLALLYVGFQIIKSFNANTGTSERGRTHYAVSPQQSGENGSSNMVGTLAGATVIAVIGASVQNVFSQQPGEAKRGNGMSEFECTINVSAKDLVGLSEDFTNVAHQAERADPDLAPMIILHGPPGTGKSLRAKAIAASRGGTHLELKLSHTESQYTGVGVQAIGRLFKQMIQLAEETKQNVTVIVDEIEGYVPPRGKLNDGSVAHDKREKVNAFAVGIDQINDKRLNGQVLIIGTTNHKNQVDDIFAARPGRCAMVEIGHPKEVWQRKELLHHFFNKQCLEKKIQGPSTSKINELARSTEGKSADDLRNYVVKSIKEAIKRKYTVVPNDIIDEAIKKADKERTETKAEKSGLPSLFPDGIHDFVGERGGATSVGTSCTTAATVASYACGALSAVKGWIWPPEKQPLQIEVVGFRLGK